MRTAILLSPHLNMKFSLFPETLESAYRLVLTDLYFDQDE